MLKKAHIHCISVSNIFAVPVAPVFFVFLLTLIPLFFVQAQTLQCNTPAEKIICQAALNQAEAEEAATTVEKDALTARQNKEEDARQAIQQQEIEIQSDQAEQKKLLSISKGNEQAYSSIVAAKAAQAAQIRAALFPLAGGGQPI